MDRVALSPDEIVRRGEGWYQRAILLVINVETGEYVLDADDVLASKMAKAAFPDAALFTMRVGRRAAYRLGGRFGEVEGH